MNKEIVVKLLESTIKDDVLLGINFLVGKSLKEVKNFFNINRDYTTIAKSKEDSIGYYRISEDCVIYVLSNIFPGPIEIKGDHIIDLRYERKN